MSDNTTDNHIVSFKLATFIVMVVAIFTVSATLTRIITKIEGQEIEDNRIDDRISKTTGRNAEAILRLEERIEKLENKK